MANSHITYRKITFEIQDELTQCEVRWETDDPILCGTGARKTFPKSIPIIDILKQIGLNVLTDPTWNRLR